MSKYAVVLLNLGGPDSLEAIKPFLFNLFSDHDIFKMPVGQRLFAKLMSGFRTPSVREKYKRIGGKSPINDWTQLQGSMLRQELRKVVPGIEVYAAMRYWHPTIKTIAGKVLEKAFDKVVLVPLYPHYSITTTGSSFNEWKRVYKGNIGNLIYVYDYYDHQMYIRALNERIDESILRFPESVRNEVQLLFSAHGLPERLARQGDPYPKQINETITCVMETRNFSHEYHLCFQSKVGPARWLKPPIDEMIKDLSARGKKHLLVIPISFVSDHIETLFELDIEYRLVAEEANIENYIVMKGLNNSKTFIDALKELTVQALQIQGEVDPESIEINEQVQN
jgi:ferrochelatase